MPDTAPAVQITDLHHRYGDRVAIDGLSLSVDEGEAFVLLGPNGSGKTTLFRLLATLLPLQEGTVSLFGHDVTTAPAAARAQLGVVFQSPSLDKKLRVEENLRCSGHLYGLTGRDLARRIEEELQRFGLTDRRRDFVEKLSGGLRRRVELAQSMLHRPRLLLLDEPSTGLDPAARSDLWQRLDTARSEGMTLLVTTHLLDEAQRCDRIAILDQGKLVALDTPDALQASVGGDTIMLQSSDADRLANEVAERFGVTTSTVDTSVRIETDEAAALVPRLYSALRDEIDGLTVSKPTLEDVFLARTGRTFHQEGSAEEGSP